MKYLIICYDIESNRSRNKISKLLLDAGLERVQKSVFEGRMKERPLARLQKRLETFVKKQDSIRYYEICRRCRSNIKQQGQGTAIPDPASTTINC